MNLLPDDTNYIFIDEMDKCTPEEFIQLDNVIEAMATNIRARVKRLNNEN